MANEIQQIPVPQQQGQMMQFIPSDPVSVLLLLPFLPFISLMMFYQWMQRSMMGNSGYKIIEIRRDGQGNIVGIFEKW